jgi:predicted nucleic acid-binding Zn ribbon protein
MTGLQMPADIELKGKVFLAWEEAVGDVATHTRPFRFRDEPAWLTELSMRKGDILNRLERAVGEKVVEDIRFQIKRKRIED